MKTKKRTARLAATEQMETFGGDYHRLERVYQPKEKRRAARHPQGKRRENPTASTRRANGQNNPRQS